MLKKTLQIFILLSAFNISAQSSLQELLSSAGSLESLQLGDEQTTEDTSKSYDYFTKNSYESTVKQLEYAESFSEEQFVKSELDSKRLELAVRLCEKDPRACFLIENYRDSISSTEDELTDPSSLPIFGTDIFNGYPLSFQSVPNVTVNNDYLIQPGDILEVTIVGTVNTNRDLQVNKNGYLSISNVGSIQVAGKNITDVSKSLREFVATKRPGTYADVFLKNISPIQVFVTGAVRFPSNYNLGGLSTPINAIISSGGLTKNASLRSIQLIRDKEIISNIDLYDLLIYGKNDEINLKGGDSIVINGSTSLVSIYGNVNRPSKYEIIEGDTVEDLVNFALGPNQFGDIENIIVQREILSGQMATIKVDDRTKFELRKNDIVFVGKSEGEILNYVSINGAVRNPGIIMLDKPSNLFEYVDLKTDLLEDTYLGLIIIKRYDENARSYSVKKYNLINSNALEIKPRDEVFFLSNNDISFLNSKNLYDYVVNLLNGSSIFSLQEESTGDRIDNSCLSALGRYSDENFVQSIKIKLDLFAKNEEINCTSLLIKEPRIIPVLLAAGVPVVGSISEPALYPISSNISAKTLLSFAGGVDDLNGTNIKYEVGTADEISQLDFNQLQSVSKIVFINAKRSFKSSNNGFIQLVGEFEFPGVYPIEGITTLSEIYERAGGLNELAFPLGGILTRESIKISEEKALQRAQAELAEIFSVGVASGVLEQQSRDIIELINLKNQVDSAKATGRLVAELNPSIIEKDRSKDLILRDGDIIYMPEITNTVTIMGDVLNPVTVPYNPKYDLDDYITLAGGYTSSAHKSKTYAILPTGASIKIGSSFRVFQGNELLPGSTIIVPKQARPLSGLTFVEVITPILANLSITAASIAAIND